eukprot:2454945-Pyramimonas_sp.AAC.1
MPRRAGGRSDQGHRIAGDARSALRGAGRAKVLAVYRDVGAQCPSGSRQASRALIAECYEVHRARA